MARVKIALPESFSFAIILPVRITDLNYGAHLGNDSLLGMLHEARVQFLAALGKAEFDPTTKLGFIMADVAIEYKGEGFYGDVLTFEVAAADVHKYGFDVVYRVQNQHGRAIANAKTSLLCFDYNTRKLRGLPPELATQLN